MILFPDETADNLYAGVLADPGNDLRRLVLADRMEEIGLAEWAEFIRVQIAVDGGVASDFERDREGELFRFLREAWEYVDVLDTPNPDWFADPNGKRLDDVSVLIRRGFPAEVRAPLALLLGGECERCGGRTIVERPRGNGIGGQGVMLDRCQNCDDEGRTHGHLAGLVRKWPIEVVVATDREPFSFTAWHWYRQDGDYGRGPKMMAACLPDAVYDAMPGQESCHDGRGSPRKTFVTRDAALAALSDAVLRHVSG